MAEGLREGRRTTPQLAVVLEAVRTSGTDHPTAERIYDRVRRVLPSISLGTVYRNLQRLVQEGKIGAAQLGARSLHYDPTATPHDHFVCRSCGRVEDLIVDAPEPLHDPARRAGHDVVSHTLVLYGQCRTCRESR
jgi:Fur family transcriptional regulator, peroxide stress response regulator